MLQKLFYRVSVSGYFRNDMINVFCDIRLSWILIGSTILNGFPDVYESELSDRCFHFPYITLVIYFFPVQVYIGDCNFPSIRQQRQLYLC